MSSLRRERERIRAEYARRDASAAVRSRYAPDDAVVAREGRALEVALRAALSSLRLLPLGERRVLEVGCGGGSQLARLLGLGARADRLCGVDLVSDRLRRARGACPGVGLAEADAAELPFAEGTFDAVVQFTMLSSVSDADVRRLAAREMARVLVRGGAVISYDVRIARPPLVAVGAAELRRLFPGAAVDARSLTLVPPLARALAPRAPAVAALLERIGLLHSHELAVVRP